MLYLGSEVILYNLWIVLKNNNQILKTKNNSKAYDVSSDRNHTHRIYCYFMGQGRVRIVSYVGGECSLPLELLQG